MYPLSACISSSGALPGVVLNACRLDLNPNLKEQLNVKRLILPAGLALAAVAPNGASAAPVGGHGGRAAASKAHQRAYERVYAEVVHKLGHRAPGRNIVKDGVARGRGATDAEVVSSLHVLQRMLAAAMAPATTAGTATSSLPVSSAGASGVPACASESGTNYSTGSSNTNASSGATGRYQITPGTAAAYGCNLSTPSGQDACAQTIYQHQGAGAWVGCGG